MCQEIFHSISKHTNEKEKCGKKSSIHLSKKNIYINPFHQKEKYYYICPCLSKTPKQNLYLPKKNKSTK